jgi:hypothetical protein
MKISKNGNALLIENPLCGNGSFTKALGLTERVAPVWTCPAVARKILGEDKWRDAVKFLLVREPVERFMSGASRALNSTEGDLIESGAGERFARSTIEIAEREGTPRSKLKAFISLLGDELSGGEVPTYLKPQSDWVASMFNFVIATHDIAAWFNKDGKVSCNRSNRFFTDPSASVKITAGLDEVAALRRIYAQDFSLMDRLVVWSPAPGRIRRVGGYCPSCESKMGDGAMLDPTKEESPPAKKSRPNSKRTRQSGRSSQ